MLNNTKQNTKQNIKSILSSSASLRLIFPVTNPLLRSRTVSSIHKPGSLPCTACLWRNYGLTCFSSLSRLRAPLTCRSKNAAEYSGNCSKFDICLAPEDNLLLVFCLSPFGEVRAIVFLLFIFSVMTCNSLNKH